MDKTPLYRRFARLLGLSSWALGTVWQLHRLGGTEPGAREALMRRRAAAALAVLNVRLEESGSRHAHGGGTGRLIAPNHVSWLDILAVYTLYPCSFIAMKELRAWPLIGKAAANAGTVFIDRSNRKDIDPINQAVAEKLASGSHVCFFPEARTSLGNNVLPLKAALFQAAFISGAAVQPLALRFYDRDSRRTEAVSFAGCNFFQSLWRIVSLPEITIRISHTDPLWPQALPEADRFAVKDAVETFLKEEVLSDSPAPERLLPQAA